MSGRRDVAARSRRAATLVGRGAEREALAAAWRSVSSGEGPAAVLVSGPAGVGKSRLVEDASSRLLGPDDVLMVGHCVDLYGEDMPYGGVCDAVRHLIRQYGVRTVRSWGGRGAPALASLIPDLDPNVGEVGPARLLEGFSALLENLSIERPVWLWIEDLQWSDRATRALVSWVLRTVAAPRLLVTCTMRTEEPTLPADITDFWSELRRLPAAQAITLQPFTPSEVRDHWRALCGGRPDGATVARVTELSGGLPFYTELLADSGWTEGEPVQESLRELAGTPLDRLGEAGRTVVEAAAVEDSRLSHDLLRDVLDGSVDVETGVGQAVSAGILTVEPGGDGYRFRHALIREAVVSRLLPPQRQRWHAVWAQRLEASPTLVQDPFARIAAAHHWVRAGNASRAFDAALGAAELAGRIVALDEEAGLLREALDLWPRVPDAEDRCGYSRDDLLRSVVVVLAFLPDRAALRQVIDDDRRARTDGAARDPVRDLVLRDFKERVCAEEPGPEPGPDRAAADLLLATPLDHPWLPRAAHELGGQFCKEGPALAERLARRAVASARVLARTEVQPRAYLPMTPAVDRVVTAVGLAGLRTAAGDVESAARILAAVPRDVSVQQIPSHVDWYLAEAYFALGQHTEAVAAAHRSLGRIPEPHRAPLLWAGVMTQLAESQLALGQWDDADRTLSRCDQVVLDEGHKSQALTLLGVLQCWRGRLDAADALLVRVAACPNRYGIPVDSVRPRWFAAELAAARGDVAALRTAVDPLWSEPGWEVASTHLWQPLLLELRAEVDTIVQSGGAEAQRARDRLDLCWKAAARLHRIGDTGLAWDIHARAERGLAEGCSESGPWEEASAAWQKTGQVVQACWARLRQASCLAVNRERDEALSVVEAVHAVAEDLGAASLTAAAAALNTRIASTGRRSGGAPYGLTGRELEVLRLVARGRSNAQLARELFISPKTVSVHVSSLLGKLQAASRTEAVATAQRAGLLDSAMRR